MTILLPPRRENSRRRKRRELSALQMCGRRRVLAAFKTLTRQGFKSYSITGQGNEANRKSNVKMCPLKQVECFYFRV